MNKQYRFNEAIIDGLTTNQYFRDLLEDVVKSAKEKSKQYQCDKPLTLYKKYSRKDACKLLDWLNDESSTMYGYKPKHQTCPIFITYHKSEEVEASVNYGDEFLSQDLFKWFTRSNRTLNSQEVQTVIQAEQNGYDIHIFIKKDNDEGTDFYYLGEATPDKETVQQITMNNDEGKELPVVTMNMIMEQPVERKLYDYLVTSVEE